MQDLSREGKPFRTRRTSRLMRHLIVGEHVDWLPNGWRRVRLISPHAGADVLLLLDADEIEEFDRAFANGPVRLEPR
jgi:hypothetical protein